MNTSNVINMPTTNTISLATSAVLVDMTIRVWAGRKKDKRATSQVERDNAAAVGVANVTKKLLADCAELEAIQRYAGNVRNRHYALTLPWSDSGLRIIPTAQYLNEYVAEMSGHVNEFNKLVEIFLSEYEWEINHVQAKLGTLFDPTEYPSVSTLRSKFDIRFTPMPVSTAADFRVDVADEQARQLEQQYTKFYHDKLQQATSDIWTRLRPLLERMSERLDDEGRDKPKIFRDSLVENVAELTEFMSACNLTNDPEINRVQQDLTRMLRTTSAMRLRANSQHRLEKKQEVDALIKTLPSLDF